MGDQRERPGFDEHASFVGQGAYFDASFLVNGAATPTHRLGRRRQHRLRRRLHPAPRRASRSCWSSASSRRTGPAPCRQRGWRASSPAASLDAGARTPRAMPPYDPTPCQRRLASGRIVATTSARSSASTRTSAASSAALEQAGSPTTRSSSSPATTASSSASTASAAPPATDGNKRDAYEESLRIPLLLRYPRLARRGVVHDAQVLNIDLAPTLLELAGVAPPPRRCRAEAWCRCSTGEAASVRGRFLYEYFFAAATACPLVALRQGLQAESSTRSPPPEPTLFDLTADPFETVTSPAGPMPRASVCA